MENNEIRKDINELEELDDEALDFANGGTGENSDDSYTRACSFCGVKHTGPKGKVIAWLAAHVKCCPMNPCK